MLNSGETVLLESDGDENCRQVITMSRKNHAIEYKPPKPAEPKKPEVKAASKSEAKPNSKQKPGISNKDRLKRAVMLK